MSKTTSSSAALPIAHVVLRILVVLNWLMLAVILVMRKARAKLAERGLDNRVP